jgi:deazaflavin-dependent oxidoreductase (nitroreductase family)
MALSGEYAVSPVGWVREQTEKILETGTTTSVVHVSGRPIVLVTIRGAKSDKLRYTPLMRVEHDGRYALVASKGGGPGAPHLYRNLVANLHVELQDGTVTRSTTREVGGDERRRWWERAVAAFAARGLPEEDDRGSRCSCWSRGRAETVTKCRGHRHTAAMARGLSRPPESLCRTGC